MSNTAQYQCKACGYSSNNPVAFDLHPCRPGRRGNWNEGILAIIAAVIIALALLRPVAAQNAPQPTPAVGGGPQIAVEHKVFLPVIMVPDDVSGQGRYWGGLANPNVSWCPSCRG